jgi:hypothetical protein
MKTRKVVSREYKVMLRPARFAGSEKELIATAGRLWADFVRAIESLVFEAEGTLDTIEKRRLIAFFDSQALHLRAGGYIFRVRRALDGSQPEVTLKFRHPDRYVAAARQMKTRRSGADIKFEEDIKAPFVSLYSFSASGGVGKKGVPATIDEVSRLFPDLSKRLGDTDGGLTLRGVNGFIARELVITGSMLRIGTKPKVNVECALIVWYDQNGSANDPVAVEFSYRYGNGAGDYGGKAARRAFDIFETLQKELTDWIDPNPRTKTAFVYG